MLRAPTVFVIGAGAGVDIDMPLGDKLSSEVAEKLDLRGQSDEKLGNRDVEVALKRYVKNRHGNLSLYNEYRAAGTTIKKGVHYAGSIDNFVNSHKDNDKLTVCAKLGILHTIIERERGCALFKESPLRPFCGDEKVRK